MCVEERFIDRYPDGREEIYKELAKCARCRPGYSCNEVRIIIMGSRNIQYNEATTKMLRGQRRHVSSRSVPNPPHSPAPSFVEIVDEGYRGSDRRSHRSSSSSSRRSSNRGDFLLDAFWGPRPRRQSSSRSRNRVHFVDTPPSTPPSAPLSPPTPPPPPPPPPPPSPPPFHRRPAGGPHRPYPPHTQHGPSASSPPPPPPPPPPASSVGNLRSPPRAPHGGGSRGSGHLPAPQPPGPRPAYSRPIIINPSPPARTAPPAPTATSPSPSPPPSPPRSPRARVPTVEEQDRQRRDQRQAYLESELAQMRGRSDEQRRIERDNAEIAARPIRPLPTRRHPTSPPPSPPPPPPPPPSESSRPRSYTRHRPPMSPSQEIDQGPILEAALQDLNDIRSSRQQLQAEAQRRRSEEMRRYETLAAETRRAQVEEYARLHSAGVAMAVQRDAALAREDIFYSTPRGERLRRRTTGGGFGMGGTGGRHRQRVLYDDGFFRYEY